MQSSVSALKIIMQRMMVLMLKRMILPTMLLESMLAVSMKVVCNLLESLMA